MIRHNPCVGNISSIIAHYEKKDGVPIKYVCSSSLKERGPIYDVYYRSDHSKHPEFGNRYFGITEHNGRLYIANADNIENLEFNVVNNVYSRNEHDFVPTGAGVSIDGGRDYLRLVGNTRVQVDTYKIKDGEFVKKDLDI